MIVRRVVIITAIVILAMIVGLVYYFIEMRSQTQRINWSKLRRNRKYVEDDKNLISLVSMEAMKNRMSTPERIVPFPVTQPDDERDSRDSRGSRELAGSIITLVKTQSKKD